jgi:fucose 4-O-acetylase-like acetyltransferase
MEFPNDRVNYIDYIRGGAMFLVIVHHCGILQIPILAFHMPVFFVVSGYLFNLNNKISVSFLDYCKKRFNQLIVPYLLFEFLNLFFAVFLHWLFQSLGLGNVYHIEIGYAIRDILLCLSSSHYIGVTSLLWFLPCMFFSDLFFWIITFIISRTKINKSFIFLVVSTCLVFISYWLNIYINFRLPFTLDISLMGVAFICLGYAGKSFIDLCYQQDWYIKVLLTSLFGISLLFFANHNSPFLMYSNEYGNYLFAICGALSGVIFFVNFIFSVEFFLPKHKILYLSTNSLIIYPIHLNLIALLAKIFSYTKLSPVAQEYIVFLELNLVIILLLPIIYVINKYFPFFTGKVNIIKNK